MNRTITKTLAVAGFSLLALPATLLAQDEAKKEKKDFQQIIITRTGDKNGKTLIEIDGDKVKVNGKDAKDDADVSVHVNTIKSANVYRYNSGNVTNWKMDNEVIIEDEKRAMLGVVTEADEKGAEIQSITKESGADKAGLKKGDIITMIDGKKIDESDDVSKAVRAHKPGDKIGVTYLRDGKEQKVTAELSKWKGINMNTISIPRLESMNGVGAIAPGGTFRGNNAFVFQTNGRPRLGLSIQDTEEGVGVKVLDVEEEGNAAKAGIKEGDVIVGIDDHEVRSTDDITRTIREAKDKYTFSFRVNRNGKTQNIEVKLPRKLKTADL